MNNVNLIQRSLDDPERLRTLVKERADLIDALCHSAERLRQVQDEMGQCFSLPHPHIAIEDDRGRLMTTMDGPRFRIRDQTVPTISIHGLLHKKDGTIGGVPGRLSVDLKLLFPKDAYLHPHGLL